MNIFKNPDWINTRFLDIKYDDVQEPIIQEISKRVCKVNSKNPLVTIVIPAYNEEDNIIRCIDSLSHTRSKYPFEILVVNNNSTDRTQILLDNLSVRSVFQPIQGWGAARQKGVDEAKGKYILTGDSDCIYPSAWVELMTRKLEQKNVACVYGRFSYIANDNIPRYKFWLYERMADVMREVRHIKRPYLNCYGMTMGYVKKYAAKVRYTERMIRGEDGRLAFDLMSYGKIKMVRSSRSRVFTKPRAIERFDGTLGQAIKSRLIKEFVRFGEYFRKKEAHDTKTSLNSTHTIEENMEILKKRYKVKGNIKKDQKKST